MGRLRFLVAGLLAGALATACGHRDEPSPPTAESSASAQINCRDSIAWPPRTDLPSIRAEIENRGLPDLISIGDGANVVSVGLRARAECVARSIVIAYGPHVEVSVGLFPFPPRAQPNRSCFVGHWPFGSVPFLRSSIRVDDKIVQGEFFKGSVRFTNGGLGPINLDSSSSFPIYLFQGDAGEPVGTSEGGSIGTGLTLQMAPGQSQDVKAYGGTASCDQALGYVIPAGSYRARALIDFSPPEGGVHIFWSDPLPVEVVAPPTS